MQAPSEPIDRVGFAWFPVAKRVADNPPPTPVSPLDTGATKPRKGAQQALPFRLISFTNEIKRRVRGWTALIGRWLGFSGMTVRKIRGNRGERLAVKHLKKAGLRILGRNIAVRGIGEIDILAREGPTLVVVEVRSRRTDTAQIPLDSVNRDKRQRILNATTWLVRRHNLSGITIRQDIVALAWSDQDKLSEIIHIRDAFRPQ